MRYNIAAGYVPQQLFPAQGSTVPLQRPRSRLPKTVKNL